MTDNPGSLMNLKYYLRKAKDVKIKDYLSFFPMLIAILVSPFFKKINSKKWIICERKDEARDNGYHLYKYIYTEHPEQKCIYAIKRKSHDYQKIRSLGDTVEYGSIKHWILFFTCHYLISSQSSMPNGYMGTLIERAGLFKPKHVFLQHGITINRPEYLMADHRIVKWFIAGAEPEYHFLKRSFGYQEDTIQYTGFPRFDALHDFEVKKKRVLVMPTWRKWLWQKSEGHSDIEMEIEASEYVISWNKLLNNPEIKQLINEGLLEVVFFPHPNMKEILDLNKIIGNHISLVDIDNTDLQELLKSSAMLITDYSSVFFDMVYMKKPVVFYQFDYEKFRKYHYKEGWFDYHATPFGKSCTSDEEVVDALKVIIKNDFKPSKEYIEEHKKVFQLYDTDNSKRVYELLQKGLSV